MTTDNACRHSAEIPVTRVPEASSGELSEIEVMTEAPQTDMIGIPSALAIVVGHSAVSSTPRLDQSGTSQFARRLM